jgi:hypothetical protein
MITFERTIDIPASRRISFTAPGAVPVGRTNVLLVFPQESSAPDPVERFSASLPRKKIDPIKAQKAIDALCGMFQTDGHDVERFLAHKHLDAEHEWESERDAGL